MTFSRGHWLDVLELLLAHLGDEALTELQAPVSGFVLCCGGGRTSPLPPVMRQRLEKERTSNVLIFIRVVSSFKIKHYTMFKKPINNI